VKGEPGTRTYSTDFSAGGRHTANHRAPSFLWGRCPMLNAWNRAEHYRDMAEECRCLAVTSRSARMSNRYWRMAENYRMLAEAEERGALAYGGLATFDSSDLTDGVSRAAYR
jgi:hypothetical protein